MRSFFVTLIAITFLLTGCATSQQVGGTVSGDISEQLTKHEWKIQEIGGENVIEDSDPSLVFMDDGSFAGNASCNRVLGNYSRKGDGRISFEPVGTTMMSCPEAVMEQEQKLLALLPQIDTFDIDESGVLFLKIADQIVIKAAFSEIR